jgi:mono/diheme cytochrome c family protein
MITTRITHTIEAHARSIMMTLAMLFAVIAMAPVHAQGPSDDSWAAPARASQRANPLMPTTDVIKHGQELFHRDCEQCHGKAGRGDGPQAFSLEKHPADLASARIQSQADGAFFWKMTEGRGVMPKATLGDKDKWSVILYIRTFAAAH